MSPVGRHAGRPSFTKYGRPSHRLGEDASRATGVEGGSGVGALGTEEVAAALAQLLRFTRDFDRHELVAFFAAAFARRHGGIVTIFA